MIGAGLDLGPMDRVFGSMSRRANDWREPFREVGLVALQQFDHRFAVGGPGWAPTFGSKLFYANILQKGGVIKNSAPKLGLFQKLAGLRRLPATYSVLPPRPIVVPPNSDFRQQIGRVAYRHFVAGIAEGKR